MSASISWSLSSRVPEDAVATPALRSIGIVEAAAHSIPATPLIRELCQDLGVELCPVRPEAKARWIYRNGKTPGVFL